MTMLDCSRAADYKSYRGLPAIAGLCSIEKAAAPGLSVDESVNRLKRYHYAFKRLFEILTARITSEPIYELKSAFSLHSYLCAEHVTAMRERVGEMREPPLGLEKIPHPSLALFFNEILCAPTTEELLSGVYGKALPAIQRALRNHIRDTNLLTDAPSVRICKFALLEVEEMLDYGRRALHCLVDTETQEAMSAWLALLDQSLLSAGDLDGTEDQVEETLEAHHSVTPYVFDPIPKRDERFQDNYNAAVQAEAFIYDEALPDNPKALMLMYKRLREIDVPELMSSIITETKEKPWMYYRDMSRQLWDEARHAMMGEAGFVALGIDWTQIRINFTWSLNLNTLCTPIERHAVLYFIEQGLMSRTGKRFEWELAKRIEHPLMALFQDFDWADEVLHAQIGREWYVNDRPSAKEATEYGDACWTSILDSFQTFRAKGLTEHENWWPELYRQACTTWGVEPDPSVLAFDTSYETLRADLVDLTDDSRE